MIASASAEMTTALSERQTDRRTAEAVVASATSQSTRRLVELVPEQNERPQTELLVEPTTPAAEAKMQPAKNPSTKRQIQSPMDQPAAEKRGLVH